MSNLQEALKQVSPEQAEYLIKGLQQIADSNKPTEIPKLSASSQAVISAARVGQPLKTVEVVIKDSGRVVRIDPRAFDSETMSKDLTRKGKNRQG